MSSIITVEPVVFSNPVHRSVWFDIRIEKSVHLGCRQAGKNSKITPEQHRLWWEESAKSKDRMLYFIYETYYALDSQTARQLQQVRIVGIVRLDHRKTWTEVWLAVKPEHRMRGVATHALGYLGERARTRRWPPLSAIVSSKKSVASWRLFTRAGFTLKTDGFVQLIQKGRVA